MRWLIVVNCLNRLVIVGIAEKEMTALYGDHESDGAGRA